MRRLAGKAAKALSLIPAVPIVLLARLLRPFKTVRFGRLVQERIGHLAGNTEYYLCRRASDGRSVDLFCRSGSAANEQLLEMWSRVLPMSRLVWPLWKANRLIPGGRAHEIDLPWDLADYERLRDHLASTEPFLTFTAEEEARGRAALRAIGVPENTRFVCFHARDSSYLNELTAGADWRYHDYRDSRIANYLPAADELARRGYAALRMGAVIDHPIKSAEPLVIDYAAKHRSDFMDIYLTAKCSFFLGTNSGIEDVADIFRRPLARTNATQLFAELRTCGPKDLIIPKRFRLEREGRFMTLRELALSPAWELRRGPELAAAGATTVENTPEEIAELAVEMDERLRGVWRQAPEDEELQRRFWAVLRETGRYTASPVSRVGAGFLRRHRDWLA